MKRTTLQTAATLAVLGLAMTTTAHAKPNGGKSNGNQTKSFKFNFENGSKNGNHHKPNNRTSNHNSNWPDKNYHKPYYGNYHCTHGNYNAYPSQYYRTPNIVVRPLGQAYEPFHSSYVVQPGDSFYTISLKEYGTSANARYIAKFNNMSEAGPLVLNQTLMLPTISPAGQLSISQAPPAEPLPGMPNNGMLANVTPLNTPLPTSAPVHRIQVQVGSTLMVDGQIFGNQPGTARLRINGLSLPVEVIDWNNSTVKIHLPTIELASNTPAEIELLRADGSVASKTPVELGTPPEVALLK